MDRAEIMAAMGELKLYGMRAAYDELMAVVVRRQHESRQIVGDLLAAEINEIEPACRHRFGPAPVSFRSFESDTRHQGDRIWQQYTAMSSSVMQFASRSPVA